MHFKLLPFLLGFFILVSCSSHKKVVNSCNLDKARLKGQKDGELGINHLNHLSPKCSYETQIEYKEKYLDGQKKGLKNYCTLKRAQLRANSHLEIDKVCEDIAQYKKWYDASLMNSCSIKQAKIDSKQGQPKHPLCLKTKTYSKFFNLGLLKHCNKRQAYRDGFEEKKLSEYCLLTNKKEVLLKSYQEGLNKRLETENTKLERKVDELNTQIKKLKKIKPTSKEQKRRLEIEKTKASKELLKTLHALGKKNKL